VFRRLSPGSAALPRPLEGLARSCSIGVKPCFLHVHGPSAFLFLGKFLRFVFDDFNLLPCEAVEFADQLVDLFVGRVDLALRPIDDYSMTGLLLNRLFKPTRVGTPRADLPGRSRSQV
jgi:hypothetical protein